MQTGNSSDSNPATTVDSGPVDDHHHGPANYNPNAARIGLPGYDQNGAISRRPTYQEDYERQLAHITVWGNQQRGEWLSGRRRINQLPAHAQMQAEDAFVQTLVLCLHRLSIPHNLRPTVGHEFLYQLRNIKAQLQNPLNRVDLDNLYRSVDRHVHFERRS